MPFSCNVAEVPRITSYAAALAHYNKIDKWCDGGKPIKGNPRRNNMVMRMSGDDVVFRLYATDCVTWHADNSCTIEGYDTMSTTAFINQLAPPGVSHCQGPKHDFEPILDLSKPGASWWTHHDDGTYERNSDVLVIRADAARLRFSKRFERWLPVCEDELRAFDDWEIDRKLAREAMRPYPLARFLKLAPAIDALVGPNREPDLDDFGNALLDGNFVQALRHCRQGKASYRFGRDGEAPPVSAEFIEEFRTDIYQGAGAVSRIRTKVMTAAEYKSYLKRGRRFGA